MIRIFTSYRGSFTQDSGYSQRGSTEQIADAERILNQVKTSRVLSDQWEKYRQQFPYASNISYEQVMKAIDSMPKH